MKFTKKLTALMACATMATAMVGSFPANAANMPCYTDDTNCAYDTALNSDYEINSSFYALTSQQETAIRKIPVRLACRLAGIGITSSYTPIINSGSDYLAYQNAMNTITGSHSNLSYNSAWCYSQNGYNYGYDNADESCATFALATALSIYSGSAFTPDQVSTRSQTDGTGTNFADHDAFEITNSNLTYSEVLLAIDAQLQMGRPALIKVKRSSDGYPHWATVIGKDDSATVIGDKYRIIDPWNGTERNLSQMVFYSGVNTIAGYAILSDSIY